MRPVTPQLGAPSAPASGGAFPGRAKLRAVPLAGTLGSIADYLPPALVSREALNYAIVRCSNLPAALTNWIYFECRLNPRTSRVDLVLLVDDVGRAIISGETPAVQFPDHIWNSPHWQRLRTFCQVWGREGSLLSENVHHIWLEFDLPRPGNDHERGAPVPGLFVSLGEVRPPDFSSRRWLSITCEALPQATGKPLPPAWEQMLARCFDRLPPGAFVPYFGMMFQRPDAGVRLCITGLDDEEVLQYAADVGWPGSVRELSHLLSEVRAARSNTRAPGVAMVHFDVGDRIGPTIGLEYGIDRKAQFGGHLRETPFLDSLIDKGLCSTAHQEALREWPGGMTMRLRHQFWRAVVLRRVNHIKLVHRPGLPLEVKAYLCAGFGAATKGGVPTFGRRAPRQLRP